MHTPETCAALDCANDPNRSRFHTTTITREGMSTMAPYDGTLTIQDPNLVTDWDVDEQTHAYVIRDVDAPAPDWDGIGSTYRQAYDHARYDDEITAEGGPGVDIIRQAWDHFRDSELTARYLRMFHGAVSVDYSESIFRDSRVWAIVTRANVDDWGVPADAVASLAADALEIVRQWAEGEVYGVIVANTDTGAEESLWSVYDATPDLRYCHEVAEEIAPTG
jgi:hypothetical protein